MRYILFMLLFAALTFVSCDKDPVDNEIIVNAPDTYNFTRDGSSTVSYSGQLTRLDMHQQLKSLIGKTTSQKVELAQINALFNHMENDNDFSDGSLYTADELNASGKNISGATGYSVSYTEDVKTQFNDWFTQAAANSKTTTPASQGTAGYVDRKADGSKRILVNENGLEYTQIISKSLMGAMQLDQIVNKYLSDSRLDVENESNEEGKSYTKMEHHWDEAFGYTSLHENALAYASLNEVPADDLVLVDRFWGEYIYGVDASIAGAGVKNNLINAFLKGREAIAVKAYDVRDEQANIIKVVMSKVSAIRAMFYLKRGKPNVLSTDANEKANAFHALSEAYGFIYSLQFSNDGTGAPYYTRSEVETMLDLFDKNGGLYANDIENGIQSLLEQLASKFSVNVDDI